MKKWIDRGFVVLVFVALGFSFSQSRQQESRILKWVLVRLPYQIKKRGLCLSFFIWCGQQDSNLHADGRGA